MNLQGCRSCPSHRPRRCSIDCSWCWSSSSSSQSSLAVGSIAGIRLAVVNCFCRQLLLSIAVEFSRRWLRSRHPSRRLLIVDGSLLQSSVVDIIALLVCSRLPAILSQSSFAVDCIGHRVFSLGRWQSILSQSSLAVLACVVVVVAIVACSRFRRGARRRRRHRSRRLQS